jgi:MFS family permease
LDLKSTPLTLGIGLSMTVGYGTLYYSFSVLAPEIAAEFGWSKSFVFAMFSAGLMIGAFAAPLTGRMIDRFGAKWVMSLGSALAAVVLALFSVVQSAPAFVAVALLSECISLMVQYEAGFAALARVHGKKAAGPITGVTLMAGFASTIFWPLLHGLLTVMTWRDVYLVLAAMNLFLALPVHLMIPRYDRKEEREQPVAAARETTAGPTPGQMRRTMLVMGTMFASAGFLMSAINASLPVLLGSLGFSAASAIWAGTAIGPSQVAARLINLTFGRRFSILRIGMIASFAMALGIASLFLAFIQPIFGLALMFGVFYGIGQGLTSIVRGVLPLEFFDINHYGRITGTMSSWRLVLSALAPVVTIYVNETFGNAATLLLLASVSIVAIAASITLSRMRRDKTA